MAVPWSVWVLNTKNAKSGWPPVEARGLQALDLNAVTITWSTDGAVVQDLRECDPFHAHGYGGVWGLKCPGFEGPVGLFGVSGPKIN